MEYTTLVAISGCLALLACVGGAAFAFDKVGLGAWFTNCLTINMNSLRRIFLTLFTVAFFTTLYWGYLTIKDPPRMTRYLTNLVVPLWGHLTDY